MKDAQIRRPKGPEGARRGEFSCRISERLRVYGDAMKESISGVRLSCPAPPPLPSPHDIHFSVPSAPRTPECIPEGGGEGEEDASMYIA